MNWSDFFTSSVGKKLVMALTGLFLISFLVVHVGLNACIWANDNGEMFNKAAQFMGDTIVVRIMEVGLFIGFIIHIIQGYVLESKNLGRRGKGYKINLANKGSKWYSRTMGLLGTLLLLFLIMHINHFWIHSRLGDVGSIQPLSEVIYPSNPNKHYHNLYALMIETFSGQLLVVTLYVVGCISLAYHLLHGFQSAFRTLGLHNRKYLGIVRGLGIGFSILVPLTFAMMPVSIYLKWIE
ncbi:MAG TPA: succinate dehydrogenase cytochrome b subunit [Chitinophagaceae bacterium]|nr:succinate dehydrogenase cytochrome b subunit [Chitinophagaceae bacterium]